MLSQQQLSLMPRPCMPQMLNAMVSHEHPGCASPSCTQRQGQAIQPRVHWRQVATSVRRCTALACRQGAATEWPNSKLRGHHVRSLQGDARQCHFSVELGCTTGNPCHSARPTKGSVSTFYWIAPLYLPLGALGPQTTINMNNNSTEASGLVEAPFCQP